VVLVVVKIGVLFLLQTKGVGSLHQILVLSDMTVCSVIKFLRYRRAEKGGSKSRKEKIVAEQSPTETKGARTFAPPLLENGSTIPCLKRGVNWVGRKTRGRDLSR